METYGFIYLASNQCMPNVYKIGATRRHPMVRINELSKSTSCPTPFELVSYFGCNDVFVAEKEIHSILYEYRVDSLREFFNAPLIFVQDAFRSFADPISDCFYDDLLNNMVEAEIKTKEIKETLYGSR